MTELMPTDQSYRVFQELEEISDEEFRAICWGINESAKQNPDIPLLARKRLARIMEKLAGPLADKKITDPCLFIWTGLLMGCTLGYFLGGNGGEDESEGEE